MAALDVEHLIADQLPARRIRDLMAGWDWSRLRSRVGEARPWAQLLSALWLFGHSQRVSSARESERQLQTNRA